MYTIVYFTIDFHSTYKSYIIKVDGCHNINAQVYCSSWWVPRVTRHKTSMKPIKTPAKENHSPITHVLRNWFSANLDWSELGCCPLAGGCLQSSPDRRHHDDLLPILSLKN